jgi:TPR repeat protein
MTVLALIGCIGPEEGTEEAAVVSPGDDVRRDPDSEPSLADWEAALAEESRKRHLQALNHPPVDAESQRRLGVMYYTGEGLEPDYAAALDWFQRAAAQGQDVAQLFLGVMYLNGLEVRQSDVRAYMWFSISAEQGNPGARMRLVELAEQMTPAEVAEARTLADEWMPEVMNVPSPP